MTAIIETARLVLRPFEIDDLGAAHQWFGDAQVMRYTPAGPDLSLEQTCARINAYRQHQSQHGFSKWVIDTQDGTSIGDAGLFHLGEIGEFELGFRLRTSHWGQGYASEAARAWVRAARDRFALARIVAFAHPENVASMRVLETSGFSVRGQRVVMGMPSTLYEIEF